MPRSPVEKRPQAIRDLADIALYLAEESGGDDLAFRRPPSLPLDICLPI